MYPRGGESNVHNTSRKAKTISFDAPPPFLPTKNPSNSGACYCSYVSMYFPHHDRGNRSKKAVFNAQIIAFQTKTAAGPRGFFVVSLSCGLVYVYVYWGVCGASRLGCGEMRRRRRRRRKFLGVFYVYKGVMETRGFFRSA